MLMGVTNPLLQEALEKAVIETEDPAAVSEELPLEESVAAKIQAYEERKRAKRAARAAAQGKPLSGKSTALLNP